jgi:GT2 family glycosyltransferase
VVCVDNGSTDGSADLARAAGWTVLDNAGNRGFPAAVNRALGVARGRCTLLLNPDVRVGPRTIERCLAELGADPTVGVVGADLRRADGEVDDAAARHFRALDHLAAETFGLTRLSKRLNRQYLPEFDRNSTRDVPCVNGAFMMLPTGLLRDLGGLDETVFMYLEDLDLCWRVAQRGLRARFVAAPATHLGGASTNRATEAQRTAAGLHRIDGDVEFVRRRQGEWARRVALLLFGFRAAVNLAGPPPRRRRGRATLGWLRRQWRGRVPPPPVP